MRDIILESIVEEAEKHISEFHEYHNNLHLSFERNKKRIINPKPKEIKTPSYWDEDKKFNPFYVLNNSKAIAKSIRKKLNKEIYKPFPPHIQEIEKKGGGKRKIEVYQIPDEAVSNYLYNHLLSKNKHRFSSLSYAYRNDRNVHFAVQDIALELKSSPRVFVAEFDFKDFFGSIDHTFLKEQLNQNGFLISEFEKKVISAFIDGKERGIPQGTSISLFLANLVCWKLDRMLEEEGLRFARYADDTIIWSKDYSKICKAFNIIDKFSSQAGVQINFNKSEGISLLTKDNIPCELYKRKEYVEFLGYKLSSDNIAIKEKSVQRIKKQISYLLYRNLIQPIKTKPFIAVTIPNNNEDEAFVTAIMQIRRYLYGNLNDEKLRMYLNGKYKRLVFKGIMSFYPLVDDESQLKELDAWLINTIVNCIRLRCKILYKHGYNVSGQFPFNLVKSDIVERCKVKKIKGKEGLIAIPSFLRIHKAIKKGIINDGIYRTMNPMSNQYDY